MPARLWILQLDRTALYVELFDDPDPTDQGLQHNHVIFIKTGKEGLFQP